MANIRRVYLSIAQFLVGICFGVLAGLASLYLINLIWKGLNQVKLGGFLTALLLLISFLIVYFASVVAAAEGVILMGRFTPKQASRRKIFEGSFLGMCAAVAILTATRSDWISVFSEWEYSPILNIVRVIGIVLYYGIVRPINFLTFWIPALFIIAISAPIGATISYYLPVSAKSRRREGESAVEQSEDAEGGKRKR